jgi:hypothetical protein
MTLFDWVLIFISSLLVVALIISDRTKAKLFQKNRLLCRENHKLRLKLKEYENDSKG